jgi:hypothetical protein
MGIGGEEDVRSELWTQPNQNTSSRKEAKEHELWIIPLGKQ